MKNFLGIFIVAVMVVMIFDFTTAQACNCGCNTVVGCQQVQPKQGCQAQVRHFSKEDFDKVVAERHARLNAELGLTKVQQEKSKAIFEAKFKELSPVISEIRDKKQALRELKSSSFDLCQIKSRQEQKDSLKQEILALKEKKKEISAKYDAQFEAMLSDSQKIKWAKMKSEMKQRHKQHHQNRCGSCGCQIKM